MSKMKDNKIRVLLLQYQALMGMDNFVLYPREDISKVSPIFLKLIGILNPPSELEMTPI